MNGSETPKETESFLWPCCQDCGRQKKCPYVYNQLLHHGAVQGRDEAKRLTKEAQRLLETISYSNDIRRILEGSQDMETALSQALSSELNLIQSLRAHAANDCQ